MDQRTYKVGRLTQLKEQRDGLRIEIDAFVKSIVIHFEPMDNDLMYVDKLVPDRLKIYIVKIEGKKKILDRINAEIKNLENELGEGS